MTERTTSPASAVAVKIAFLTNFSGRHLGHNDSYTTLTHRPSRSMYTDHTKLPVDDFCSVAHSAIAHSQTLKAYLILPIPKQMSIITPKLRQRDMTDV
ncbi:hypothetical protein ACTXT7_014673 [Hymenolepis weldensis]